VKQAEVIDFFARWIELETGIIYEVHNLFQLQDRLEQLSRHFGLESTEELWQKAQDGIQGEFRQKLTDIATNNETSFFRDKKFYDCLRQNIFPSLIAETGKLSSLKIWSVASSTGQEPYSLVMILTEMGRSMNEVPPRILATDISERALDRAKAGRFTEIEVNRGLSSNLKSRYFKPDLNNQWILDEKIRNLVDFQHLNLRSAFSLNQKFDLILCRNVLIYQRVKAKTEIINKITSHLRPGGIFLMGSGESLIGLSSDYLQILTDGTAVYRKKNLDSKNA